MMDFSLTSGPLKSAKTAKTVKTVVTTGALLLLSLVPGNLAHGGDGPFARVLYLTGFERPGFRAGVLTGQRGFIAYGDNSIEAAMVVRDGWNQCVRIDGSRLGLFDGDYEGYYYPFFDYDPVADGRPLLEIGCDLRFSPTRDGAAGYAGIAAYDPEGEEYARMRLDADGRLYWGGAQINSVPVAFHRWHRLQIRLDFTQRAAAFFLNGRYLGTTGFASPTATRFGDADLHLEAGDRPAGHLAYFDNYTIVAARGLPRCPPEGD